jgi:hypothetical protein
MRILAFSDIHRDKRQAVRLAERAREVDVVVAAGDFASVHRGLDEVIDMLVVIETPTVLVPGNNETEDALREACRGWHAAHVLHGEGAEIDGMPFFGLRPHRSGGRRDARRLLARRRARRPLAAPRPRRRRPPPRQRGDPPRGRGQAAAPGRLRPHPRVGR